VKRILFLDTTLRDGEQSPGATMFPDEKLRVAKAIEKLGEDIIEAGFAAASLGEMIAIDLISKMIKNAKVCSLDRSVKGDIDAAAQALKKAKDPRIHVFIPTGKLLIEQQMHQTEDEILKKLLNR